METSSNYGKYFQTQSQVVFKGEVITKMQKIFSRTTKPEKFIFTRELFDKM
jgi:hypothetical protein